MSKKPSGHAVDLPAVLRLAHRIGHDLNNVLQSITVEAERLAEQETKEEHDISDRILAATAKGVDLIRALMAIGAAPSAARQPALQSATVLSTRVIPARILVADDQEHNRTHAKAVLSTGGHVVVAVADGQEAVDAARSTSFDFVLMDIQMPVLDGLEATRKIRQLGGAWSHIPIVAFSGNVTAEAVKSFKDVGMNDYLGKPFDKRALFTKVNAWLGEKTDGTAFDDLCELMGRSWAFQGLAKLRAQMDDAFKAELVNGERGEQLANQAHALVSLAALLGFPAFSRCCSVLEEACKNGSDIGMAFTRAKAAAALVDQTIAGLIEAG